jgi:hypothetical protein
LKTAEVQVTLEVVEARVADVGAVEEAKAGWRLAEDGGRGGGMSTDR